MNRKKWINNLIIIIFISVPVISSLISMVHLFNMYDLGNIEILAIASAVCIELGAISSFLSLSTLSKLNRTIVWSMFFLLFFLQIIGNIYYSFDYITQKMILNPTYLNSFQELMSRFFIDINLSDVKLVLSIIIGAPIPLISLMLLKSLIDYIKPESHETNVVDKISDISNKLSKNDNANINNVSDIIDENLNISKTHSENNMKDIDNESVVSNNIVENNIKMKNVSTNNSIKKRIKKRLHPSLYQ